MHSVTWAPPTKIRAAKNKVWKIDTEKMFPMELDTPFSFYLFSIEIVIRYIVMRTLTLENVILILESIFPFSNLDNMCTTSKRTTVAFTTFFTFN